VHTQPSRVYEFGPFELHAVTRRLLRQGEIVPLTPKAFDLLLVLVQHRDRVLEKEELMRLLWTDTVVEEGNLTVNVSLLRKALGDHLGAHPYIVTVPGRGYRFVAPIRETSEELELSRGTNGSIVDAAVLGPVSHGDLIAPDGATGVLTASDGSVLIRFEQTAVARTIDWSAARVIRKKGWLWAAAALVLVLAGTMLVSVYVTHRSAASGGLAVKSLAVLPFQPLVAAARDESLEFGMADALMTKLSHLRQLTVRPTESVRKYSGSGQDLQVAGRELRVDALLVGSLQRAGDRIRLSVRLIGTRDGRVLWAETFDEHWAHVFAVEDAIANQVTRALALRLTGPERELLAKRDTENPAAYREYLMGRHYWNQWTSAGLKRGLQHFERAVALDPSYALAHAGMADSYTSFAGYRVLSPKEGYVKARAAAVKALSLDPALSEPHATLALVSLYHDWDWTAAEREFTRAIQLKPDNAEAHMRYALALVWFERFDEALREIGRARELNPLERRINVNVGQILYYGRRYDEATEGFRRALMLDPNFWQIHQMLGWAYVQTRAYDEAIAEFKRAIDLGGISQVEADLAHAYAVSGQAREARTILSDLKDRSTSTYISPLDIAVVYTGLGDHDEAFAWLEKAYDERTRPMLSLNVNPRFDPLRSDPRFTALMRRVGMFNQSAVGSQPTSGKR